MAQFTNIYCMFYNILQGTKSKVLESSNDTMNDTYLRRWKCKLAFLLYTVYVHWVILYPINMNNYHISIKIYPSAAVFNLYIMTPLRVERPFHTGNLRPYCISDIYLMTHNSSEITIMK